MADLRTLDPDRSDLQTCQLLIGGRGVRLTRVRHPRGLEHLGAQHLVGGQAGDLLEHALSQGVVGVPVGEALTRTAQGRQPRALRYHLGQVPPAVGLAHEAVQRALGGPSSRRLHRVGQS